MIYNVILIEGFGNTSKGGYFLHQLFHVFLGLGKAFFPFDIFKFITYPCFSEVGDVRGNDFIPICELLYALGKLPLTPNHAIGKTFGNGRLHTSE